MSVPYFFFNPEEIKVTTGLYNTGINNIYTNKQNSRRRQFPVRGRPEKTKSYSPREKPKEPECFQLLKKCTKKVCLFFHNLHFYLQRNFDGLRVGDVAKGIVLILTILFFICLLAEHNGLTSYFSDSYKIDGFCVSGKDLDPIYQSHSVCFIANSITAAIMMYLVTQTKNLTKEAIRPMKKNAISLFGHGIGHLFLSISTQTSTLGASQAFEMLREQEFLRQSLTYFTLFWVWFGFNRDSRRSLQTTIILALFHNTLQFFFLPTSFFFVHVLLSVLGGSSVRGIWFRNDKDLFYDLEAVFVDVPILIMTFTEALTCDSFLASIGGHFWFDMVVPFGFYVYYAIILATGHGLKKNLEKIE